MSSDLTSTVGVIALTAGAVALVCLALIAVLTFKLKMARTAQRAILGERGEHDLVEHASALAHSFDELSTQVESTFKRIDENLSAHEQRLGRSISRTAVVRYDAYDEMSGRQSSSMALLDDTGTGVVLSSILHREQARMYVKGVRAGQSELDLSPEEQEAIRTALDTRASSG